MPQMAPMWWIALMITFSIMLIMLIAMMYFNKNPINKNKSMMSNKNLIWMW
uniref:ATP synthase F0 subunit 8 n=1 Tax=Anaceratagallia venosa TaxID=2172465 RepID=UPI0030029A08|nr:ATP synthase F0 subunit 8 [Anaceratagallia venosa]